MFMRMFKDILFLVKKLKLNFLIFRHVKIILRFLTTSIQNIE